jgi:pyruvate-ferredoxin/flavodoxin oxidoreductase
VWSHLPVEVQRQIVEQDLRCYVIDAHWVARDLRLGGQINTVMQSCFFALSGVLPREQATAALKEAMAEAYGKRGPAVVERNQAAIEGALHELEPLPVPARIDGGPHRMPPLPDAAPDFVKRVTERLMAGGGDLLPVSALSNGQTTCVPLRHTGPPRQSFDR